MKFRPTLRAAMFVAISTVAAIWIAGERVCYSSTCIESENLPVVRAVGGVLITIFLALSVDWLGQARIDWKTEREQARQRQTKRCEAISYLVTVAGEHLSSWKFIVVHMNDESGPGIYLIKGDKVAQAMSDTGRVEDAVAVVSNLVDQDEDVRLIEAAVQDIAGHYNAFRMGATRRSDDPWDHFARDVVAVRLKDVGETPRATAVRDLAGDMVSASERLQNRYCPATCPPK